MLSRAIVYSTTAIAAIAGASVARTKIAHAEDAPVTSLPSEDELQLVQAQVVLRHGWRAPLSVSKTFGDEASETAALPWVR
jgi:hypothetical protein